MSNGATFLDQLEAGLQRALVPRGAVLVVAFSGGPDSSALLRALSELRDQWNFNLRAVHVNHNIRSGESERDERIGQRISVL